MSSSKLAVLRWAGEGDVYTGVSDSAPEIVIDSDGAEGPSPMDALLLGLMACMAIDVRMILEKSRVPMDSLEVRASGIRAEEPPRRFTHVALTYVLEGPGEENRVKVQRAIDLSRDKYCSVLHTLRPDLEVEIRIGEL